MINLWANRQNKKSCFPKKAPISFFTSLFKRKKCKVSRHVNSPTDFTGIQRTHTRAPSTLSVSVMDMRITSPCPISPALSTLTLTPGRTRDIDQDMEALRLSRQDNPFLQVLASRESLVDEIFDSNLDNANLMAKDQCSVNDLDMSLPEIHEHMIRSPPPTTWPKSPNYKIFKFPAGMEDDLYQELHFLNECKSGCQHSSHQINKRHAESTTNDFKPHQRSSSECRRKSYLVVSPYGLPFRNRVIQSDDVSRHCHSVRSLSDVRRAPTTLQLRQIF